MPLLVFILHFLLCVLSVWLIPVVSAKLVALAVVFLAALPFYALLFGSRQKSAPAAPAKAGIEPTPLPEETRFEVRSLVPVPPEGSEIWEEAKKTWDEADLLLDSASRTELFTETWTSFGESLDRMQANSKAIFENSKKVFDISDNLSGTAEKAFALSEKVQAKVKELTAELAASLGETRRLSEESKKIVGILEMMSEISSKTYVLSINASVVATRAGIHGRAFGVVAKEIRKLAQETETSLKNIEDFVGQIQSSVQTVVDHTTLTSGEIEKEKDSLLSVAGALQGVILAVEIIRTVSNLSKEKAQELQAISEDVIEKTRLIAERIRGESTADRIDLVRQKIKELRQVLNRH